MKKQKIIRYRLSVSRYFPATHQNKGEDTGFIEHILSGAKIHTIRANADLWEKRMLKVQEGKAVIELFYWSGKPRKSKQVVFKVIDKDSGCGIQLLDMSCLMDLNLCLVITNTSARRIPLITVCLNDGLKMSDFKEWFKKYDLSETFAVIHFTGYRYH